MTVPPDPLRPPDPFRPPDPLRPDDPLAALRRWEDSGGTWVVRARTARGVDVALLTCDAGEEMGRLVSDDPALLAYLGARTRSDD